MVQQCLNLYENNSSRGTLFVSFDDSKYLIKFYDSIKVEVLLEDEICGQGDESNPKSNNLASPKSTEAFGRWGDYIDLLQISSDQGISETSQKIVKADDGQYLTITTLNPGLVSEDGTSDKIVDEKIEIFDDRIYVAEDVSHKKDKIVDVIGNQSAVRLTEIGEYEAQIILKTETDHSYHGHEAQASNDTVHSIQEVPIPSFLHNVSTILSTEGLPLLKQETVPDNSKEVMPLRLGLGLKRKAPSVHACRDCFENFDTTRALKEHRKVTTFNEYQCNECSEVFQFQAFFEVHKKSNHGSVGPSLVYKDNQYWYSCDSCGMLMETLVKLQIHYLSHTGEGIFQCCRCPQKFGDRRDFNEHMKTHKSSGNIRCRWCNKWFANKSVLAKHKLVCKVIKCHLCGSTFPNKTSRNQHYKDFHPSDILKCELCSYMFSSQEDLNDHVAKHSKFKKKQCTLCGLFFSRLKKHMLVHKNPDEYAENEIYYCDKCPAKFTNQATFSRHWKTHSGEKPYQCPNCPRTFANCGVLYKHIKRHKSLLPNTCEVCGNTCASIDELKSHMKTHSDDNLLFPCSMCTQAFMYKGSLEAHIQMKHSTKNGGPKSVTGSADLIKTSQNYNSSTVTSFGDNTSALVGVVIQEIRSLIGSQDTKYEVVIQK